MEKSSLKSTYHIGDVQFSPNNKRLIFNRYRSVKLSNRETLILSYMLEQPNRAITLSEFMNQCLKQYPSDPVTVRKTIQILSAKLEVADKIEYPYIDCYRFRCECTPTENLPWFNLKRLKRLFTKPVQMSKELAPMS